MKCALGDRTCHWSAIITLLQSCSPGYPYTPEAILIIRDLLRGKLRFRSQPFKRGKSLRPLGAWSENYWLAIKSAQAASIRKTPRCLASPQILGQQRNSLRFEVSGDAFRMPAADYVDFGMPLQFFECICPRRVQQTVLCLALIDPGCYQ